MKTRVFSLIYYMYLITQKCTFTGNGCIHCKNFLGICNIKLGDDFFICMIPLAVGKISFHSF